MSDEEFTRHLLKLNGFDTPEKVALRAKVLSFVYESKDDELHRKIWALQDAYGAPGTTPPQGWDWSGIRDSSFSAIEKMAEVIKA